MRKELSEGEIRRRAKLSESTSRLWKDPAFRERVIRKQRELGYRAYGSKFTYPPNPQKYN